MSGSFPLPVSRRVVTLLIIAVSTWIDPTACFPTLLSCRNLKPAYLTTRTTQPRLRASGSNDDRNVEEDDKPEGDNRSGNDGPPLMKQVMERMESIQVEKARTQLERANTQSFLKRRPIKLPYNDARRWVQANLGCDTKEEFYDLVANGNLRTPYIPKNPENYYTETREWISWDHFLKGCFDNSNPSAVQPKTGIFD